MTITSIKQLTSRLKAANKVTVQGIVREASVFCGAQLNEHRNADPVTMLYKAIPGLASKPKGVTQTNLRQYVESIGLDFDKKRKVFTFRKGVNLQAFDAEWFQAFVKEPEALPLEARATRNMTTAIKQFMEAGLSEDEIVQRVAGIMKAMAEAE